jgi:hypothetical protein
MSVRVSYAVTGLMDLGCNVCMRQVVCRGKTFRTKVGACQLSGIDDKERIPFRSASPCLYYA